MTDIVERLRERADAVEAEGTGAGLVNAEYFRKSASEIEWLKYIVMRRTEVVNTQATEIERLRKALRDVIRDVDGYNALLTEKSRDGLTWVSVKRAREALGDD